MSETFLIKKAAYNNAGTIAEHNAESFIIGPGELNGPGGLARDSDLELYGFGALKWGEGVDQNLYRLLENHACPRKVTNDFLPGTDDPVDFIPGNGTYNSGNDPVMPKDEFDLGVGNGITMPLFGQQWFDTTSDTMLIYPTDGLWVSVNVSPATIQISVGQTSINDLVCDGSAISRTKYAALFSIIGIDYGPGNNSTTFNLPDLTSATPTSTVGTVSYIIRT